MPDTVLDTYLYYLQFSHRLTQSSIILILFSGKLRIGRFKSFGLVSDRAGVQMCLNPRHIALSISS